MLPIFDDTLVHPPGAARVQDLPLAHAQALVARAEAAGCAVPVPVGGTVYGALMNDPATLAALGSAVDAAPYKAAPRAPVLQVKPRNTWVGHGGSVALPPGADTLQLGASLGVLIGRVACRLDEAGALDAVAGYTVVNDLSVPNDSPGRHYRPALRFKAADGLCPIGPWVRAAAAVPDPDALTLRTWVDGELVHSGLTGGRVRGVARLLAEVTEFMTLQPGDLLILGPVEGAPRVHAGQWVEIEIEGVGRLAHHVAAAAEGAAA
jgi:5-oxopent-3-ene-1,2,5-tricarboxylate decarboxylase/2-hydroxyhepta-2,4-diene-1,7-dioate isomerase